MDLSASTNCGWISRPGSARIPEALDEVEYMAGTEVTCHEEEVHQAPQPEKPKTVQRLPDLELAKSAVLNSLTSVEAQRGYSHAIDEFVDWYCSEPRLVLNRIVVVRYRNHLASRQLAAGTINLRLGAVRRLAYEAADCGLLSADLAAGIRRVHGVRKIGVRLGNWLTADQGKALWQAPDAQRNKGKRDRALLALLLACGLRRREAATLRLRDLEQREEHWAIVDLVGKGGHIRTPQKHGMKSIRSSNDFPLDIPNKPCYLLCDGQRSDLEPR